MTFGKNLTAVRWFSTCNIWMDFIVICDKSIASNCERIIDDAMEEWFDFAGDDGYCYGDYVEEKLGENYKKGNDWFIVYHDDDEHDYDDEYERGMDNFYNAFHYFD